MHSDTRAQRLLFYLSLTISLNVFPTVIQRLLYSASIPPTSVVE